MTGVVTDLYRYPVKGLSADQLQRVAVEPCRAFPFDRAWAIENGPTRFDPESPAHVSPASFLTLKRDERLATLETRFDEQTQRLVVLRGGRQVASGILSLPSGRQVIEQFLAAYMAASLRGRPRLVSGSGHSFSDTPDQCVHVVNSKSLGELEQAAGRSIDPLRFRPNILIDGPEPWAEFYWLGQEIKVGHVRLKVWDRTLRCAATNVDPKTGLRDMAIPAILQRKWGHGDFGVYAQIMDDGEIAVGQPVSA